MNDERYVICGDATRHLPPEHEKAALRLHLYGRDDDHKVTLKIDEIRRQMYKEVPKRFHDLLDIATYVYAADQATRRGTRDVATFGSHWRRDFCFVVPVRDLDFWRSSAVQACLTDVLDFLSDDHYEFEFVAIRQQEPFQAFLNFNDDSLLGFPEQVVMYSGGLDSVGGAVEEAVIQKRRVVLVNHRSTQKLDKHYACLQELLNAKSANNLPTHIRVTVHKKKWMNREHTQRSRSFLYMALGATIAEMLGLSGVRFYENGVLSLNLPICAQVVGGRATRTTHPRVIRGFEALLSLIHEQPFSVDNPFCWKTKAGVIEQIAKAGCADLIAESISCTHTWEITNTHSHCGYCSQCIDRRFAVIAANQEKHDPLSHYRMDVFTESRATREHVNEDKMLFASYLERANEVDRVAGTLPFLKSFPEVARALAYLNDDPGTASQRCYEMYRRHSTEVNEAVDTMLARHRQGIRQRIFPADSLLRVVYESSLPTSVPATPPAPDTLPENIFRRQGGAWQVRFQGGKEFVVLPWRGADYIHALLSRRGERVDAIAIVCGTAAAYCDFLMEAQEAISEGLQSRHNPLLDKLGAISDWEAVRAYRDEARELMAEKEQARDDHDEARVQELDRQMSMLLSRINEAVGIRGKLKQAGDKKKNVRDSFRSRVKDVIQRQIQPTDASLAAHLLDYIKFGNCPKYEPPRTVTWELDPIVNE